jgi:hypothetical protein
MKKYLTIPVAMLILLSGMHFTIATHFCGGEIASTKISVTGKLASCGMTSDEKSKTSSETSFASNCCEDEIAVYAVDSSYTASQIHTSEITHTVLHGFCIPEVSFHAISPLLTNLANARPPGSYMVSAVNRTDICVFRI